jgi:hypothetical protein
MPWASPFLLKSIWRLSLCAGLLGSVTACVQVSPFATQPVDSGSPIAADVSAASVANTPFPTFANIPTAPQDVRSPEAWRKAVASALKDKRVLETQAEANPATLFNPEAFARAARARAATRPGYVPTINSRAETEAFAKDLRERATPPPPPQ